MDINGSEKEIAHIMWGWYDGPRSGIADYQGKPHLYESLWDPKTHVSSWTDLFLLMPLDAGTFELAMEDWHIWLRWEEAFYAGRATQETRGSLPEDRKRSEDLDACLPGDWRCSLRKLFSNEASSTRQSKRFNGFQPKRLVLACSPIQALPWMTTASGGLSFPKA